jgi:RNA polymerase sigma factor (sigma-70 family)
VNATSPAFTGMRSPRPPSRGLPEVDVIRERFAAGDERALGECQSRFGPLLLANARRVVGPSDAEDVVQTVMMEAWRKRHRYDPSRPLEAWLLTILQRRAIDHLRKQKTVVVNPDTTGELSGEDGREAAQRFALAFDVRRALHKLPDRERETLVLAYFGGMSQSEVASRTGTPLGTIKARTRGGLKRLASLIGASALE